MRVFKDKENGLIVDYIGVFRNLRKALAIYGVGGGADDGSMPIQDKSVLLKKLKDAIESAVKFCRELGFEPEAIQRVEGFERIKLLDEAVEFILVTEESKKRYLALANYVNRLFKAVLPDKSARELAPICLLLKVLAKKILSLIPPADISKIMGEVETLLDRSVAAEGYLMPVRDPGRRIDLSHIDFEKLRRQIEKGKKRAEVERLKGEIKLKVGCLVQWNQSRMDFQEEFQRMIDEYNSGSLNIDELFNQLISFAQRLNEEEKPC